MEKMKVGILGSGDVGKAFARAFSDLGHRVKIGSRSPEKLNDFAAEAGPLVTGSTFEETARFGDLMVLATLGTATQGAIQLAGPKHFEGKVVLDATNPLTRGPDGISLEIGHSISAGEKVQGWAAGASVFKTLNTTGFGNMANSVYNGVKSVMFVAGDDAANKPKVIELVSQLGFDVVDAGPLRNARLLEAHAMLWIDLAVARGQGRDFAFAFLRR